MRKGGRNGKRKVKVTEGGKVKEVGRKSEREGVLVHDMT
jgi:hypothetical protein